MNRAPRPGDVIAGRFVLEAKVGAGAHGLVHRARDEATGRTVAVKLLEASSADAVRRFAREAEILVALEHPAIVRAVLGGYDPPWRFLALEWIEGGTLAARLRAQVNEGAQIPRRRIIAFAEAVARALDAAHARGVVHRDLKPANVLLRGGDLESPAVADFGVAKILELDASEGTTVGRVLGTPLYLSPEQARGLPVDGRSDVFALASILFELATLRHAWGRDWEDRPLSIVGPRGPEIAPLNTLDAIRARIIRGQRPKIAPWAPELAAWDPVLERAFAAEPADRPSTAIALVEALAEVDLGASLVPRTGTIAPASTRADPLHREGSAPLFEAQVEELVRPVTWVGPSTTVSAAPSEGFLVEPVAAPLPPVVPSAPRSNRALLGVALLAGSAALGGLAWLLAVGALTPSVSEPHEEPGPRAVARSTADPGPRASARGEPAPSADVTGGSGGSAASAQEDNRRSTAQKNSSPARATSVARRATVSTDSDLRAEATSDGSARERAPRTEPSEQEALRQSVANLEAHPDDLEELRKICARVRAAAAELPAARRALVEQQVRRAEFGGGASALAKALELLTARE